MRTLLIDNYDSYTYNLYQYLAEVNGELPLVFTNDEIDVQGVRVLLQSGQVQCIVISPGPGTPEAAKDIGVCLDVLRELPDVPLLGVCLGHQALGIVHGARVIKAPEPVHGRLSSLQHTGHPLMAGIPSGPGQGFEVVRYHSLVVDEASLPDCLEAIAWTCSAHHALGVAAGDAPAQAEGQGAAASSQQHNQPQSCAAAQRSGSVTHESGGVLMAMAHRTRPHMGVQFHPESVCTRYGIALLANFQDLAAAHLGLPPSPREHHGLAFPLPRELDPLPWPPAPAPTACHKQQLGLAWAKCSTGVLKDIPGGSQLIFERLFAWGEHTFWLDRPSINMMGARVDLMSIKCILWTPT